MTETREITLEKDYVYGGYDNKYFLKLHVGFFRSGLCAKIGTRDALVLLAIAHHMDKDGFCYPTQRHLERLTGMTRRTIGEAIKRLRNTLVNGKPLLIVEKRPNGQYGQVSTGYSVNMKAAQLSIFDSGSVHKSAIVPLVEAEWEGYEGEDWEE
ncbi:helix-turn-helix domain-containing protein [Bacillus cereus]